MRRRADAVLLAGAILALQTLVPIASLANEDVASSDEKRQAGEDRWVASLAVTSGLLVQKQAGSAESFKLVDNVPPPVPLRPATQGDDILATPFVGGSVEVMSPAVPMPTRPRFWISGEVLPSFGSDHALATQGDPGCIRGPEPGAPCAVEENGERDRPFGASTALGQGSRTTSRIDTLTYGASAGLAFPVEIQQRQVRIKPAFAWMNYKLDAKGVVVAADCQPTNVCTDYRLFGTLIIPGFLREEILRDGKSRRFNGIGPALDVEMDTGKYGPLGVSLFAGARAYYILGDRSMRFGDVQMYNDLAGMDTDTADFGVTVERWIYRGHVGIRFSWLGE